MPNETVAEKSEKPLVVLCVALSGLGHINATTGVASELKKRGHRVVFTTERSWAGKLIERGFEEEIYDEKEPAETNEEPGAHWSQFCKKMEFLARLKPEEQLTHATSGFGVMLTGIKYSNKRIGEIISSVKPDVIIYDGLICYPSVVTANVPWINLFSANPLKVLQDGNLPPAASGLTFVKNDNWDSFREAYKVHYSDLWKAVNEWAMSQGAPSLPPVNTQYTSNNLNLYLYPKKLASIYLQRRASPSVWIGVDHGMRPSRDGTAFDLPEKLLSLPGKLIYLSLGSMGSSMVGIMKQLVDILSKTKHKYIVSRGQSHQDYEISDNMWGKPFLPQTAVLPLVDLVITHGGNNSFVETLYYGKPMIVFPLFGDQHDNAVMAVEAKLGSKLCISTDSLEDLPQIIDDVLNDEEIHANVKELSKELRASNALQEAALLVEEVACNPRKPFTLEEISTSQ